MSDLDGINPDRQLVIIVQANAGKFRIDEAFDKHLQGYAGYAYSVQRDRFHGNVRDAILAFCGCDHQNVMCAAEDGKQRVLGTRFGGEFVEINTSSRGDFPRRKTKCGCLYTFRHWHPALREVGIDLSLRKDRGTRIDGSDGGIALEEVNLAL